MPRNRFVEPDQKVRLELSEGDWVEIKKELNVGDQKRLEAAGVKRSPLGTQIDWEAFHVGRMSVWLLDWSFRNAGDRPVEVSVDAIKALDVETFQEIQDAISGHIEAMDAEKKTRNRAKTA